MSDASERIENNFEGNDLLYFDLEANLLPFLKEHNLLDTTSRLFLNGNRTLLSIGIEVITILKENGYEFPDNTNFFDGLELIDSNDITEYRQIIDKNGVATGREMRKNICTLIPFKILGRTAFETRISHYDSPKNKTPFRHFLETDLPIAVAFRREVIENLDKGISPSNMLHDLKADPKFSDITALQEYSPGGDRAFATLLKRIGIREVTNTIGVGASLDINSDAGKDVIAWRTEGMYLEDIRMKLKNKYGIVLRSKTPIQTLWNNYRKLEQ